MQELQLIQINQKFNLPVGPYVASIKCNFTYILFAGIKKMVELVKQISKKGGVGKTGGVLKRGVHLFSF